MNVRRSVAATVLSLSLLSLAACGEDAAGLEGVKISATAGKAPTITYPDDFAPEKVEIEVLKEGKGPKADEETAVKAHVWISNSVDDKVVFNTYDEGQEALELIVGDVLPGISKGLEGQQEGAVVAVTGPASELFTEYGYPEWGIGNGDAVVVRTELLEVYDEKGTADVVKRQKDAQEAAEKAQKDAEAAQKKAAGAKEKAQESALKSATGTKVKPAAWAPKVTFGGEVPKISFAGTPKPTDKLLVTETIVGKGKKVAVGDAVVVKYVGQVHGADQPFDSSYSRGADEVLPFTAGAGEMIQGFDTAVQGKRVGSRLIVQIPPALGYGEAGQGDIKGTDTMVFVIDIVGAA